MKKIAILFAVFLMSCGGVKIKGVTSASNFALSNYKTYNFYEVDAEGDALSDNYKENLELVKTAVSKQMVLRGLTQTSGSPDLLVNIGAVVSEEIQTRETSFANPADRMAYMGQRNYSWQVSEVEVGRYREGSVTLDLVDSRSVKLLWQGSADSILPTKEKNLPALIDSGIAKLFEKIK